VTDLKLGVSGLLFPPIELGIEAAKAYEAEGIDFIAYWDQLNLTIPRSIWTPDLCPAAERWHIDTWMEPWPVMAATAMATQSIEFMTVNDSLRRPPSVLAQLSLTMSHIAKGRFFLTLGAGEVKQFAPYGLARPRPFAHLEEMLKILRMFFDSTEPVTYNGPIWNLRNGVVGLPAYQDIAPMMAVAGGPGKAFRFGATLADGWMTYLPISASPEQYAEHVIEFKRLAEQAGKDPEDLKIIALLACFVCPTEELAEQALRNPVARWDGAAIFPSGEEYRRLTGKDNPLGADWSYPRDLIPMDVSREYALEVIAKITPDDLRATRFVGTPEQAADQIQPYIDAGANHLLCLNCADLILAGDYGDAMSGNSVMSELFKLIRERNGDRVAVTSPHEPAATTC
jgi:phthiodiolone/phenolphthiodiolone dimycocerosates ketoreductase